MKIPIWFLILIFVIMVISLDIAYSAGYNKGKIDTTIEVVKKVYKIDLSAEEGMKELKRDWLGWND